MPYAIICTCCYIAQMCALISNAAHCWMHCMYSVNSPVEEKREREEREKKAKTTTTTFQEFTRIACKRRAHFFSSSTFHILLIAFVIMAFSSLSFEIFILLDFMCKDSYKMNTEQWYDHSIFPFFYFGLFLSTVGMFAHSSRIGMLFSVLLNMSMCGVFFFV